VARPAYSKNLVYLPSVEGVTAVGGPPTGYLWVVRTMMATFGSFLGYVEAALGLYEEGPWSWLATSSGTRLFSDHHQTFTWEGRYVVPGGFDLYVNTSSGDTCDIKLDGYELSVEGAYE
jgi:hypothetical protein